MTDMPAIIYDQTHIDWLVDLATELELSTPADRRLLLRDVVLSSGGTLTEPRPGWGPLCFEIAIAGVVSHSTDFDSAIAEWIKAAMRVAQAHQEDIAS
jgi:hypothetical protein